MRSKHTITHLSTKDLLFIPVKPSSEKETTVLPPSSEHNNTLLGSRSCGIQNIYITSPPSEYLISPITQACLVSPAVLPPWRLYTHQHEHTAFLFSATSHYKFPLFSFLCSLVLCYLRATSTLSLGILSNCLISSIESRQDPAGHHQWWKKSNVCYEGIVFILLGYLWVILLFLQETQWWSHHALY